MPVSSSKAMHMPSTSKTQPPTSPEAAGWTDAVTDLAILVAGEVRDLYEAGDPLPYLPVIIAVDAAVVLERARCAAVARSMAGVFPMGYRLAEAIERGDGP